MMNVIQIQDALKGMPMEQLIREMQMPSGQAPQFLVLGEIARRKQMEKEFAQRQGQPQTTVAEDAVTAAGVPQQGIASAARAMAPQTDMVMNTAPTQQLPVQGMADGGYVQKMQVGGFATSPEYDYAAFLREMGLNDTPDARDAFRRYQNYVSAQQPYKARIPRPDVVTRAPAAPSLSDVSADISAFMPTSGGAQPTIPAVPAAPVGGIGALMNMPDTLAVPQRRALFEPLGGGADVDAILAAEDAQGAPPRGLAGLTVPPYALRGEPEPVPVSGSAFGDNRVDFMGPIGPGGERIFAQPDFDPASVTAYNAATRAKREAEAAALEAARLATDARVAAAAGRPAEDLARRADDARAEAARLAAAAQTAEDSAESLAAAEIGAQPRRPPVAMPFGDLGALTAEAPPPAPSVAPPSAAPTAPTAPPGGIAAAMSPFETELTNLLQQREKRAEQDKWLALAQVGMSLMGSRQPTFAGALGEAGAAGLQQFQQGRAQYDKDRLELMALLENTRLARAKLAAAGRGGGLTAYQQATLARDARKDAADALKALIDLRASYTGPDGLPIPAAQDDYDALTARINQLTNELYGVGSGAGTGGVDFATSSARAG